MKLGTMFTDILKSFFKRPITQLYPFEKSPAPERLRGKLIYDPAKCVGCMLCVKDCCAEAIEIITVDKATKRFVALYHVDRCTYCAQCVQNCRFKCLEMSSQQWELAALNKEAFEVYYGRDEDIEKILSQKAETEAVAGDGATDCSDSDNAAGGTKS